MRIRCSSYYFLLNGCIEKKHPQTHLDRKKNSNCNIYGPEFKPANKSVHWKNI